MFGPRTVSTRPETCCVKISMDTIDPREKTLPTVLTPLQEVATGVDAGKVRRIVLMPARPRPRRRLRAQGVDHPDGDQRSPLPKPEHRHAIAMPVPSWASPARCGGCSRGISSTCLGRSRSAQGCGRP